MKTKGRNAILFNYIPIRSQAGKGREQGSQCCFRVQLEIQNCDLLVSARNWILISKIKNLFRALSSRAKVRSSEVLSSRQDPSPVVCSRGEGCCGRPPLSRGPGDTSPTRQRPPSPSLPRTVNSSRCSGREGSPSAHGPPVPSKGTPGPGSAFRRCGAACRQRRGHPSGRCWPSAPSTPWTAILSRCSAGGGVV